MQLQYRGSSWTILACILLTTATVAVVGWGRPDVRLYAAAGLAGASQAVLALRYRRMAVAYRDALESGLALALTDHLRREFRATHRSQPLSQAIKDLEN